MQMNVFPLAASSENRRNVIGISKKNLLIHEIPNNCQKEAATKIKTKNHASFDLSCLNTYL